MTNAQIVIMDGQQIKMFVKKMKSTDGFTVEIDRPNHKCIINEAGEKVFTALKYSRGWDCRIEKYMASDLQDCVFGNKKPESTAFKFWKNNSLDAQYELTSELVLKRFLAWLYDAKHKDGYTREWLENMGSLNAVMLFVGQTEKENKHALQSVAENETYIQIASIVKESFWQYVNSITYVNPVTE